jgi:hypothetical protein
MPNARSACRHPAIRALEETRSFSRNREARTHAIDVGFNGWIGAAGEQRRGTGTAAKNVKSRPDRAAFQ